MAKYKAYPEYKDSGVEWLGAIPEDWSVTKLKYIADLLTAKSTNSDDLFVGLENISSGDGKYISKEENIADGASVSFEKNDVLFGKLRPYLAKSWSATFSGVCSSEFLVLRTAKLHPKYLNYYSLTNEFIEQVNSSTYGSKMPRASWEFIGLLPVPTCSYSLSEKVACFLDHETAKIDKLIERQQQLIELLKEKRQAVISHAVTKGLNPDVPMKDSGVEWLGEVPEHWRRSTPIKYLSSLKGRLGWQGLKADEYRDEGPYVVSSAHFNNYEIDWNSCPRVSLERYKLDSNIQLDVGDILLMKDGAAMGKLSYVDQLPGEACLNSHLLLFRPLMGGDEKTYDTKFMFYLMQTNHFQSFIKNNGTGSTFLGISQQAIGNHPLCLPPYNEQVEISDYLDDELSKIVRLETMQLEMKNLLTERRTALISAAVTGKIDVRDWVAPDTQDLEEPQEATA